MRYPGCLLHDVAHYRCHGSKRRWHGRRGVAEHENWRCAELDPRTWRNDCSIRDARPLLWTFGWLLEHMEAAGHWRLRPGWRGRSAVDELDDRRSSCMAAESFECGRERSVAASVAMRKHQRMLAAL